MLPQCLTEDPHTLQLLSSANIWTCSSFHIWWALLRSRLCWEWAMSSFTNGVTNTRYHFWQLQDQVEEQGLSDLTFFYSSLWHCFRHPHILTPDSMTGLFLRKLHSGLPDIDIGAEYGMSGKCANETFNDLLRFVYEHDDRLNTLRNLSNVK